MGGYGLSQGIASAGLWIADPVPRVQEGCQSGNHPSDDEDG